MELQVQYWMFMLIMVANGLKSEKTMDILIAQAVES